MSDYLRRLAERAVGVAQSIKPRALYRFEAVANSLSEIPFDEPPDAVARMDDEERAPDAAAGNAPIGRAKTLRPPSRSRERSPVDVSPLPHTTTVTTASILPEKAETRPAKSSPATKRRPSVMGGSNAHAQPDRSPRRNERARPSAGAGNQRPAPLPVTRRASESQVPLPENVTETHASGAGASTIGSERLAPRASVAGRSFVTRSEESQPIVHAREFVRTPARDRRDVRRAVDGLSSDRKSGRWEEHTVAVTIGRVEVRAVMEPPKAPSRARRAATSGIPLDDYLKRHEAKRR